MAQKRNKAALIAVGGHEDKTRDKQILRKVVESLRVKKVVVATVASSVADEMWRDYRKAFGALGVETVHLKIQARTDATDDPRLDLLEGAGGLFFTGGDQVAITAKMGGTILCERMHELHQQGKLVVAGTSAGASVLTETMVVSGADEKSHRAGSALLMAPGLGFLPGTVIDQHFAERGRISRLLGIVAQNPRTLGIGIDENTAIVVEGDTFEVVGEGAVYVLDGRPITHTNLNEQEADKTISVFDVRVHVLSHGDRYQMEARRPEAPKGSEVPAESA
ncbi:MAG TPA: cyanophycinase [Bryobacteraceae bacterium]|nr:cyanophycinase [Bryobacteraceae bacterium]